MRRTHETNLPPLRKQIVLSLLLTIVLKASGCGAADLFKGFQVALQSSRPLVTSLVSSGVLNQTQADAIVTDFGEGAQCGVTAANAFAAIPGDLPANEKKARKFSASQTALQCFRVIVQRRNFASHPRIQNAADIADGILASLVIFYSSGAQRTAINARNTSTRTVDATSEDELEERLRNRVKELKAALKP